MNQLSKAPPDQNSVIHSTFTIERNYPQSPARVFFPSPTRTWCGVGASKAKAGKYMSSLSTAVSAGAKCRVQLHERPGNPARCAVSGYRPRSPHRVCLSHGAGTNAPLGLPHHRRTCSFRQRHAPDLYRAGASSTVSNSRKAVRMAPAATGKTRQGTSAFVVSISHASLPFDPSLYLPASSRKTPSGRDRGNPGAEGATAPETLRQKDRRVLELWRAGAIPLTEGAKSGRVGVTVRAKSLRFSDRGGRSGYAGLRSACRRSGDSWQLPSTETL